MTLLRNEKRLAQVISEPSRPLRIAQIAPLYESVPPKLYGGTERIVAYLAEELVRRGHEVTLVAHDDNDYQAYEQAADRWQRMQAARLAQTQAQSALPR